MKNLRFVDRVKGLPLLTVVLLGQLLGTQAAAQATAGNSASATTSSITYTVVTCNDGDTCRLKSADNTQIKVRLIGIDAPESGKKRGRKKIEGQPGADEAKSFLNAQVSGKSVSLRTYGTDMYNRNLAEIIVGDEAVNLKMIKEGWAEVYKGKKPSGFNISAYESAEMEARKAKKGIWALPGYESPKDWRKKNKN